MLTIFDQSKQGVPIKVWLGNEGEIDPECLKQGRSLSKLPFIHRWVALMPDTHPGYGMPIGGVAAMIDTLVPNAVGVDIGCGMIFNNTNIPVDQVTDQVARRLVKAIMQAIPVGFKHRTTALDDRRLSQWTEGQEKELKKTYHLYQQLERALVQLGTLGGGNHFIELQEDEHGMLCIMIHSGSRHFGHEVAKYYNEKAKRHCKKNGDKHAIAAQLAYLPAGSQGGVDYIRWMHLAQEFAAQNRQAMMTLVQDILLGEFPNITFGKEVNAHHNYASLETHYGQEVWVHRKGAIRARSGELGIIPGAMGANSYIVEGLGNEESFHSCSHGAGRHMSRKEALKAFQKDAVIEDLESMGIYIGVPGKSVLVDESRFAYKDIHEVMRHQEDLAKIVRTLKTKLVVKG